MIRKIGKVAIVMAAWWAVFYPTDFPVFRVIVGPYPTYQTCYSEAARIWNRVIGVAFAQCFYDPNLVRRVM